MKGGAVVDPESGDPIQPRLPKLLTQCMARRTVTLPSRLRGRWGGVQCSTGYGGHPERDKLILQVADTGV